MKLRLVEVIHLLRLKYFLDLKIERKNEATMAFNTVCFMSNATMTCIISLHHLSHFFWVENVSVLAVASQAELE